MLDCFCGIGTISLPLATKNIEVHGIDINIESIIQAKNNAELNGIRNAFFYSGDVSELIKRFDSIHGLVIDPPRKGLKPALIKVIKSIRPQKIAYLSCDVSTLARDLSLFTKDKQYFIERVYPVDFFPQTTHIECLALLRLIRT